MKRRVLSTLLAVCLLFSIVPTFSATAMAANTYTTSLAQTAESAINKSYSQLGLPSSNWCVRFVGYCINNSSVKTLAGSTISTSYAANPMTLANWMCTVKKIGTYYSLSSTHTKRLQEAYKGINIVSTSTNSFSPQAGDIIIFDWNGREDSKHVFSHAGIVTKVSGSNITYVDGNSKTPGNYTYVKSHTNNKTYSSIIGYIRINDSNPTLSINLTTKPTSITQGNSFGLYGTVTSGSKITKVQGYVINASGKTVLTSTDTPNSTSMDINKANLNKKLTFNTLAAGKYTLKIVATDASGKSATVTQSFTVVKSNLKINLTSYPTSIKKGSSYGLRGTVSSNVKVTKVQGYVINSSGKTVLTSTDTPNSTSLNIQKANLNNKLTFNKLAVGTYTMKVVATDASGNSVTWSKTFKVTK